MCLTEDQEGLHETEQNYKMTSCSGLPGTKEVLNTDKYQFKNKESPEPMEKADLLREQLPRSGERLTAV